MCEFELIAQPATATKKASATDCDCHRDWGATALQFVAPGRNQSRPVTPSRTNFFRFFSYRRLPSLLCRMARPTFGFPNLQGFRYTPADLEVGDTAGLETCDTGSASASGSPRLLQVRRLLLFLHAVVTLRELDVELATTAKNNNALP